MPLKVNVTSQNQFDQFLNINPRSWFFKSAPIPHLEYVFAKDITTELLTWLKLCQDVQNIREIMSMKKCNLHLTNSHWIIQRDLAHLNLTSFFFYIVQYKKTES